VQEQPPGQRGGTRRRTTFRPLAARAARVAGGVRVSLAILVDSRDIPSLRSIV
jgi:hypothetical protein